MNFLNLLNFLIYKLSDPYSMVLKNLLLLFVTSVSILILKLKRKKLPFYALVFILSLLPILSILRPGVYESGDHRWHSAWLMSFYQSFEDGNINPRWADGICNGYGCPNFNFYYRGPYYLGSLFHLAGLSYVDSIKAVMFFSYLLSGIMMYQWLKEEFNPKVAIIGSILYQFSPYHFVSMHYRNTIGETLAFGLIPLVLLTSKILLQKRNLTSFLLFSVSFYSLIVTHIAITLTFIPFLVAYILQKTRRFPLWHILSGSLGIGLSAYYLIPAIVEKKYIPEVLVEKFQMHPWWEYFSTPWRYGLLFQGNMGELGNSLGFAHWLVLGLSLYILLTRKRKKETLLSMYLLFFLAYFLFMQVPFEPIWLKVQILRNFQTPHRLLLMCTFFASTIGGIVIYRLLMSSKRSLLTLAFVSFTILSTILNWGNRRVIPNLGDSFIESILPTQSDGIFVPLTADYLRESKSLAKVPIQFIEGEGAIDTVNRETEYREYFINTKTSSLVRENTLFFPGWKLYINGIEKDFLINHETYKGLLVFEVPSGQNTIQIIFEDTPVRKVSELISVMSLSIVLLLSLYRIMTKGSNLKLIFH